ncbi:26S proteasome non-ATPase regulatory subunit 14 [Cucumispora dikerogammari]|nr:26S proteasome non-ATPase regulatory subunit 14 [Cucumispora dikerogammari]
MEFDYLFDQSKSKPLAEEHYIIHPLPLLKILVHARSGIPLEVMGQMLGVKVNSYTITLIDVFAMPQSASGVTVEAVDPVFQSDMMDLLALTGRPELSIGWYHSHPGFGCWLSSTDVSTQVEFEKLDSRALAVVVDPIQSVKGNVVIDAFRAITNVMVNEYEISDVSCNKGYLSKPTVTAIMHGLGRSFYSVRTEYACGELEKRMLRNINNISWTNVLSIKTVEHSKLSQTINNTLVSIINENKQIERNKAKKEERLLLKGRRGEEVEMVDKRDKEDFLDEALRKSIKETQLLKEKKLEESEKVNNEYNKIGEVIKLGKEFIKPCIERQIMINIHRVILNICGF